MTTIRQYISTLANSVKALSIDDFISPKFLYNLSQQAIADFLKKDNSASRLTFKLTQGWTEIPNLPMVEVDVTECNLGAKTCVKLMRSKYRLPSIYESKFGPIVKQVMSLNFATLYNPIFTPKQYEAATKRQYGKDRYYFILDGYLYIPVRKLEEGSPEIVRIEAYFKDKWEVAQFINKINGSCESCKSDIDECKPRLSYEMVIPMHLENEVKQYVISQIASIYLKVTPDELPNMNQNQKNIDPKFK